MSNTRKKILHNQQGHLWRRESQVLVTVYENDNPTFEENNIAGRKANVPPTCILHTFTVLQTTAAGTLSTRQPETESTTHKYNSAQLQGA